MSTVMLKNLREVVHHVHGHVEEPPGGRYGMSMVMSKNLRRFLRHVPPPVILSEGAAWV
jgi:hypothetical protein